jgi:transcriptional regulator EpsA
MCERGKRCAVMTQIYDRWLPIMKNSACDLSLVQRGTVIKRHVDLLQWLQGDFQFFLPHDILIAGWGNFEEGHVHHDVVSGLPGVRSYAVGTECLPFLLGKVNDCWVSGGRKPGSFSFTEFAYRLGSASLPVSFCEALRGMRSAVAHGISDQREKNDCVYVFLSARSPVIGDAGEAAGISTALKMLLPVLGTALRQLSHLPQQHGQPVNRAREFTEDPNALCERETQIMAWVAMGKTNSEIGSILNISAFTVKNHMQRIFQKLNVFNRAQAVSKVTRVPLDA